jgi:hypothetical protein
MLLGKIMFEIFTFSAQVKLMATVLSSVPAPVGRPSESMKSCGTQTLEHISKFTRAFNRKGAPELESMIRSRRTTSQL